MTISSKHMQVLTDPFRPSILPTRNDYFDYFTHRNIHGGWGEGWEGLWCPRTVSEIVHQVVKIRTEMERNNNEAGLSPREIIRPHKLVFRPS